MLFGIDAHVTYQAGLNIESLAREGFTFLVVKATQGTGSYVAPATFDDWIRRGRAAGMVVGAYHWLDGSDPVRQADTFVSRLASVGGPDGLMLQIDCEDTTNPASAAQLTAFVAQLRRRAGAARPLLLYSGGWWYGAHLGAYNAAALGLHLWHSHYVGGSGYASTLAGSVSDSMWIPGYGGWPRATVLQFSSRGTAGGIAGNVDVNLFDGGRDELLALTSAATTEGDDMTWDQASAILGGAVEAGFADNANVKSVPEWVKPSIGFNLRNVSARLDALTVALNDAKGRDAANAVSIAALQSAVTKLVDALSTISVAGGGIEVDPTAVTDAIAQVVRAEAATVRDLVERRHVEEMNQLQRDRDADIAALTAQINALRTDAVAGS